MRFRVTLRSILSIGLAALLFMACGDDEKAATTGSPASSGETTTTSTASSAAAATEVKLTGLEYKFDAGTAAISIPAGRVKVTLTNGGGELHQATIVRLNDGVDFTQLGAAGASDPTGVATLKLVTAYGGPNVVGPGAVGSSEQVLDKSGNYLFICNIPAPDGQPHAAKGMVLPFTVTGSSTDTISADGTTIEGSDFAFTVPSNLKSGAFSLKNTGQQMHELSIFKLGENVTTEQILEFFEGTAGGPPPAFSPAGGVGPVAAGGIVNFDLNLAAGNYAFLCFIPDTAGSGAPHAALGMKATVTVT